MTCPNCQEHEWEIIERMFTTYYKCRWCRKIFRPHELEEDK